MDDVETIDYHTRRKHIKKIIEDSDETLTEICNQCGRDTRSKYKYVWMVMDGSYGKTHESPKVLDDLQGVLIDNDMWIPVGEIDISEVE